MKSGVIAITLGLAMMLASITAAEVPNVINNQGRLTTPAGVPLFNDPTNAADGQIDLVFSIYDAPTNGAAIWGQTNVNVAVHNGLFSVLLGNLGTNVFPATGEVARWLEMTIITNGVASTLAPRKEIVSVAYALRAGDAATWGGLSSAELVGLQTNVAGIQTDLVNIQSNVIYIQSSVAGIQTNVALIQTNLANLQSNLQMNVSNLLGVVGYVVGQTGREPYSNIQVAVNAAVAAGYGPARPVTVEVKPGRYTNDLVLQAGIHLKAEVEDGLFSVVVVGNHSYNYSGTEDGDLIISGIAFYSPGVTATDPLFLVTGNKYTSLRLNHCVLQATDNGPALRLANTGVKSGRPSNTEMFHCRIRGLKADSTAVALVELNSGSFLMDEADIYLADAADRSFRATGGSSLLLGNAQIRGRIETADNAYLQLTQSAIDSGNQACIAHNSANRAIAFEVYLNSSAGTVVTGVGPLIYNNLGLNSPTQTLATAYGVYPVYTEGASNLIYRAGRPGDWSSLFTTVPTNVSRALDLLARGATNVQANFSNVWSSVTNIWSYASNVWSSVTNIQTNFSFVEHDPQVGTIANGYVPRWQATNLVTGAIFDDGNIGIGTNSPDRLLHLKGSAPILKFEDDQGQKWWFHGKASGNSGEFGLYDETAGAYRLYLKSGRVGIGTTIPGAQLDVNGAANLSDSLSLTRSLTLRQSGVGNRECQISHDGTELKFRMGGGGGNVPINFSMFDSSALYIDGNRNVGINRTNPTARLHISQQYENDRDHGLYIQRAGSEYGAVMYMDPNGIARIGTKSDVPPDYDRDHISLNPGNGNVGIGTTVPQAKLDVRSPTDWYLLALDEDGSHHTYLRAGNPASGVVIIGDQQTERTVIQPNAGNVGVGTGNPGAKLDVRGDVLIPGGQSLKSDGGYDGSLRLNAPGSVSVFVDNDNNAAGEAFRILHNSTYHGGGAEILFSVNEAGETFIKGPVSLAAPGGDIPMGSFTSR